MGRMLGVAPVNENGEIDFDGDAEGSSVGAFWRPMPSRRLVEADLQTPELLPGERGIVLSVPVKRCTQLGQPDSVNYKTRVDTMELRSALLFWDKIDCPKNDLIVLSRGSDLAFLLDAGIAYRSEVKFSNGWDAASVLEQTAIKTYESHNEKEPGRWALMRNENSLTYSDDGFAAHEALQITLYKGVIVPDRDVPLEEILNFKEKRKEELLNFRSQIDKMLLTMSNSESLDFSKVTQVDSLDKSMADIAKVMKESKFKKIFTDLSANIKMTNISPAVIATGTSMMSELPMMASLGAGAALLGVSISAGMRNASTKSPFEYIIRYHEDLPWI